MKYSFGKLVTFMFKFWRKVTRIHFNVKIVYDCLV